MKPMYETGENKVEQYPEILEWNERGSKRNKIVIQKDNSHNSLSRPAVIVKFL